MLGIIAYACITLLNIVMNRITTLTSFFIFTWSTSSLASLTSVINREKSSFTYTNAVFHYKFLLTTYTMVLILTYYAFFRTFLTSILSLKVSWITNTKALLFMKMFITTLTVISTCAFKTTWFTFGAFVIIKEVFRPTTVANIRIIKAY